MSHQVNRAATTSAISSDTPDPSVTGQPVVVQYSVAAVAPGAGSPTGNVTVSDGSRSCTGTVAAGQCSITLITAGTKSLTATYAGDADFAPSPASAGVGHQVNRAATTSTITADSPDPSVVGQAVTVNYSVAANAPGSGLPSGNVTVTDGVSSCTGTVAAGQCAITLTTAGSRPLTATYAGNADYNASPASASVGHQVNRAATTSTIGTDNPDPSVVGQPVTVQYSVTSAGGTPAGNVTVSDGVDTCTGTVAAGQCSITLNTAGSRSLTATYAGNANFAPSPASAGVSASGQPGGDDDHDQLR